MEREEKIGSELSREFCLQKACRLLFVAKALRKKNREFSKYFDWINSSGQIHSLNVLAVVRAAVIELWKIEGTLDDVSAAKIQNLVKILNAVRKAARDHKCIRLPAGPINPHDIEEARDCIKGYLKTPIDESEVAIPPPCDCFKENGEGCPKCAPEDYLEDCFCGEGQTCNICNPEIPEERRAVPNQMRLPLSFGPFQGLSIYQIAQTKGQEGFEYLLWLSRQKYSHVNKGMPFNPKRGMGCKGTWYKKDGAVDYEIWEVENEMWKINRDRRKALRRLVWRIRRLDALLGPYYQRQGSGISDSEASTGSDTAKNICLREWLVSGIRKEWPHRNCDHDSAYQSLIDGF